MNPGHYGYEPYALASWAISPDKADNQIWTGDLHLTKVALYQLSYISIIFMEGTGFEPVKAQLTDLQSVPFGQLGYLSGLSVLGTAQPTRFILP